MSVKNKWKHRGSNPTYSTFVGTFIALSLWTVAVTGIGFAISIL